MIDENQIEIGDYNSFTNINQHTIVLPQQPQQTTPCKTTKKDVMDIFGLFLQIVTFGIMIYGVYLATKIVKPIPELQDVLNMEIFLTIGATLMMFSFFYVFYINPRSDYGDD